jgi:hypothetical protein
MGCDPVVWAQVDGEIRTRLQGSIRLQEAQAPLFTSAAGATP